MFGRRGLTERLTVIRRGRRRIGRRGVSSRLFSARKIYRGVEDLLPGEVAPPTAYPEPLERPPFWRC